MAGKVVGIIISSVLAAMAVFGIIFFAVKRSRTNRTENAE